MDLIGKLLANRYEVEAQLGGGGMAIVYKARCTFLNRDVTIKVLRPEYTSDEEFVVRFRREAQAVASLSHVNIVNVYDVGHEGNIHYIVMEYIEGNNLKEIIRERGALPVREAVDIAKQICEGLEHAHENGIIHRDIKPHNILITKGGRVKVTDFGIARAATSSTVTHSGTIVGSVHYFSPEQAKGEPTGVRSDIYSLGVVLYEMVTGKVPFEGESPIAIALKQIQEGPARPRELNPNLSPDLEKIIIRAMAKNPAQRYASAKEMYTDLSNVFLGQISDSTKAMDADEFATQVLQAGSLGKVPNVIRNSQEPIQPPEKKRKLNPWAILMGIALVLGLGLGGVFALSSFMRGEEVAVPKVVGYSEEMAQAKLQDVGLRMKVREYRTSDQEKGTVVFQSETEGKKVKKNREILVDVSKGEELIRVPSLRGQVRDEARSTLSNLELLLGKVDSEYSEEVSEGAVVKQDPEEGTEVAKNSPVNIWLSKGPEPVNVPVPQVEGLTVDAARKALQAAKLVLDENYPYEDSTQYEEGIIIRQEPANGTQQAEGTQVKVVVSKGPGPEEKTSAFQFTVPFDGVTHQVEVKVFDQKSPEGRSIYEREHNPGDVVSVEANYVGTGYLQIYLDGKPSGSRQELK